MGVVRRRAAATRTAWALAALALLVTAACGPIFGPHARSDETGDPVTLCNAKSARVARCEPARAPELAGACNAVRDTRVLRADWVRAEVACLANEACNADDDCELVGYRTIGVTPLDWPPVVRRCIQMGDICGGAFATCRHLTALTDEARAAALRCFSTSSCDDYATCFRAFVASHVDPAVPTW
jgi:hypothetical protein